MLAANLPGRILPAILSDRCFGPLNTLIPGCLFSSAVIFLWIGTTTTAGLFILACFYGFASAGIQALFSPAITVCCPRLIADDKGEMKEDPSRGVKNAVVFMAIGLACLTGTPIGGVLVDIGANNAPEGMSYLYAQVFAGLSMALGGFCFLGARVFRVGWTTART